MTIEEYLRDIGGRKAEREIPDDLKPFSCYIPDSGYCILAIPLCMVDSVSEKDPFMYAVPMPERYVLEKGYRFQFGLPVVEAEYNDAFGLMVDEQYETWDAEQPKSDRGSTTTNMESLKVGDVYAPMAYRQEGTFFDYNGSFTLFYNYYRPTADEVADVKADKPFEIRIVTIGGVLLILSKAGNQPWQDAPFNPHFAKVKEYPVPSGTLGYSLLFMMTDAASGRIQSLRLIGLGHDFSTKLREVIMESLKQPFDNDEYHARIDKVYRTYSTEDLLRYSIARFKVKE
nr:hypothetical protein [Clostridia bacterium]